MNTAEVRERYNNDVPGKFRGSYERNRWFKNPILESGFRMTKKSIRDHLPPTNGEVKHILELGPGPGTWSKILIEKYKAANFDLVDISREMLSLSKEALSQKNINYYESDFLEFDSDKRYDLFFSSRAIEYFPDKKLVVEKINSLLNNGGAVFFTTKTPQYWKYKIMGRKIPAMHRNQTSPKEFKRLLLENGFENISIYPVTMSFPFFKSVFLNDLLHKIFYRFKLNFLSQIFSESYGVKCNKK